MNDIGWAVKQLLDGKAVTRSGWNGKNQYLKLQHPADETLMTLPYIYISTVTNERVPWLASQTDSLATDWKVVE